MMNVKTVLRQTLHKMENRYDNKRFFHRQVHESFNFSVWNIFFLFGFLQNSFLLPIRLYLYLDRWTFYSYFWRSSFCFVLWRRSTPNVCQFMIFSYLNQIKFFMAHKHKLKRRRTLKVLTGKAYGMRQKLTLSTHSLPSVPEKLWNFAGIFSKNILFLCQSAD